MGVELGIFGKQDQPLVRCVHEPLQTKLELEFEEVTTKTMQSEDERMFLTPLPATEVVLAPVPDACMISNKLRCLHGTKKPKHNSCRLQTPNKRSENTILI